MTGFGGLPVSSSSSSNAVWHGTARIKGPKWARMPVLTIGMLGLQIVWSVEMGYASPYLLQLGLSKSLMSIVFVAGPLSGLIMQPLIGVLADHSKSRLGRRRPYMIGGSLVCVLSLILLGYTRWFSNIFTSAGSHANDMLTIAFAVWSIYCIDFSINAVQAAYRALLVDVLSPVQQEVGNAWAGRMFGFGSVAGFFVGNVDLPKVLPFLGDTQLEVLTAVTCVFLLVTLGMTSGSVTEKVLVKEAPSDTKGSFMDIFRDIWKNVLTLPRVILQICIVQFFSWIAWFPILFFSTVWVGEIYTKEALAKNPSLADSPTLASDATRAGSRALLWSSVLSLGASIILPFMVHKSSFGEDGDEKDWTKGKHRKIVEFLKGMRIHLATLWMVSHILFAITMGLTYFTTSVDNASALITLTGFSWAVTQWVPFSLIGEAILVAVPQPRYDPDDDAPIPLTDREERQQLMFDADADTSVRPKMHPHTSSAGIHSHTSSASSRGGEGTPRVRSPFGMNPEAGVSGVDLPNTGGEKREDIELGRVSSSSDDDDEATLYDRGGLDEDAAAPGISAKAGIILGIHNIFVVIPQFLITGLSSILFAIMDADKSVLDQGHAGHPAAGNIPTMGKNSTSAAVVGGAYDDLRRREIAEGASGDSIGLIFRIGGVSAAIAALLCWKLSRELTGKGR